MDLLEREGDVLYCIRKKVIEMDKKVKFRIITLVPRQQRKPSPSQSLPSFYPSENRYLHISLYNIEDFVFFSSPVFLLLNLRS